MSIEPGVVVPRGGQIDEAVQGPVYGSESTAAQIADGLLNVATSGLGRCFHGCALRRDGALDGRFWSIQESQGAFGYFADSQPGCGRGAYHPWRDKRTPEVNEDLEGATDEYQAGEVPGQEQSRPVTRTSIVASSAEMETKQDANLLANLLDPGEHDLFSLAAERGIDASGSRASDELEISGGGKAVDYIGRQQICLQLRKRLAGAHQRLRAALRAKASEDDENQGRNEERTNKEKCYELKHTQGAPAGGVLELDCS